MKTTPGHVFELLALHPYPGAKDVALDGSVLTFTVNGVKVCLDDGWHVGAWRVSDRIILSRLSPYSALDKLTLHTEIARVLRLAAEASPPVQPNTDLQGAINRIGEAVGVDAGLAEHDAEKIAFIERRVEATRERCDALQQILPLLGLGVNSPADKARERIEELGAEIDRLKGEVVDLTLRLGTTQNRVGDLESELAGARQAANAIRRERDQYANAVIKERAEVKRITGERDRYQQEVEVQHTRADAAEAKVKRLLRQRNAAHDVLDEAGIGLEPEGSPRWTLARRCRAAVAPVWGYLDAMWTLDEIAKLCGLTAPSVAGGATHDEVIAAVKALAADAGFYRLDRPAYLEANQARERIAAHLRLPGATWAQLADAIVAPKPSRLRRALARLVR